MIYGKNSKFRSICQNEGKPHLLRQLTIYLYNIEKFVKFLLVKPIMHGNFNLCPHFFSGYVTAWCTKHNRSMQDGHINDAVTEQISYARNKFRNL